MKALASALFLDIFSTGSFVVRVKVVRGVPRLFIFQKMGEVMRGLSVPLNEVEPLRGGSHPDHAGGGDRRGEQEVSGGVCGWRSIGGLRSGRV